MAGRLQDKVAIITGGGSGMGRDTVLRFLEEGARVLVADINEANGRETVALAKAQGHGDRAAFTRCDVAEEKDVAAMVAEAEHGFGTLDIAFLNAGIGGAFGPIGETTVEGWDYTFAVLVRSVFLGMKHASQAIRRHGRGGAILSTASIAGMVGGAGSHAYSAAKAAVISLTENVAAELAPHRIRVNAIAPGVILTERFRALMRADDPLYKKSLLGASEPEDVAQMALYLASDASRRVTGAILPMDSGASAI
jgi:NAD(P)-dependent dehydrogenase (short-subunit alcohol dehydrogenase family)